MKPAKERGFRLQRPMASGAPPGAGGDWGDRGVFLLFKHRAHLRGKQRAVYFPLLLLTKNASVGAVPAGSCLSSKDFLAFRERHCPQGSSGGKCRVASSPVGHSLAGEPRAQATAAISSSAHQHGLWKGSAALEDRVGVPKATPLFRDSPEGPRLPSMQFSLIGFIAVTSEGYAARS